MAIFDSLDATTNKAFDKGEELLRHSEKFYTLKLFQLSSLTLTMFVKFALVGIFSFIGFIFIAIALAQYFGKIWNNQLWGYLATALIFFALSCIVYALKSHIETILLRKLSKTFFSDEEV